MKRGTVGMIDLYVNIKNRRIELKMTQAELAQKVGYADKGMVSRVENGKVNLSQSQILKFAEALETDPATLMGWNSGQPSLLIDVAPKGDREEAHINEYAKQLYELYQKARPEVQKAIDALLKVDKQP